MLTLDHINEAKDTASGTASSLSRQVAFAGLAFLWIFKEESEQGLQLPEELFQPAVCLILAILCDLLQYVSTYIIYWLRLVHLERKEGCDRTKEHEHPGWMNFPAQLFFSTKLLLVLVAYCLLLSFAITTVSPQSVPEGVISKKKRALEVSRVISVHDAQTFRVDLAKCSSGLCSGIPVNIATVLTPKINGECASETAKAIQAKRFIQERLNSSKTIELREVTQGIVSEVWVDEKKLSNILIENGYAFRTGSGENVGWCSG